MKKFILIFLLFSCSSNDGIKERPFIDDKNLNKTEVLNFQNCAIFSVCEN